MTRGFIVQAIVRLGEKLSGWWGSIKTACGVVGRFVVDVGRNIADAVSRIHIPVTLRVMPLGDSITYGVESSDGNGYRDELYSYLEDSARDVDFVGSVRSGSMDDRDNEGHPGDRIHEIARFAYCSVPQYQPNVVTLHAGTNDMNLEYNLPTAPTRRKQLVNQVLAGSPRATVLVATLIPTGKAGLQPRIDAYNAALPGVVEDLRDEGKHVHLVDMSRVPVSDGLQDDAHPTDAGYAKMADAWYDGVLEVYAEGWLQAPLPEQAPGDCNPADSEVGSGDPGDSGVGSGGTALGEGWRALGVIAPGYGTREGRTVIAELNGDQRADYLQVGADGSVHAFLNRGGGGNRSFEARYNWANASDYPRPYVQFADISGDGKADYLVVYDGGSVRAWLNRGGN